MNSLQTGSSWPHYKSSPKLQAGNNMDKYMLPVTQHAVFFFKHKCISMYLRGVDLSLNDVQNGDVAVVIFSVSQGGYHYIFGLNETKKT